MIFQGCRKLESLVNIQKNLSFFSLISSSTIPERPSNRTMDSLLNSKHHCSTLCSWKILSCRNSFSSLWFSSNPCFIISRIFFQATFIRASSSQFELTTERNLLSQWDGEFQVLSRFNSTLYFFPGCFQCWLILEHSSRGWVHSCYRLFSNSSLSLLLHTS